MRYECCDSQYAIRNTEYRIRNTQYAIRNTQYAIRNTQYAIRNTQYAIRNMQPLALGIHSTWDILLFSVSRQGVSRMKNKDEDFFAFKPRCLTPLALVIILYLMYSPTFLVDYLMNDEWGNIGLSPIYLRQRSARYFFTHGRGLFGIYQWLVYSFVEYDPLRVQFIRFVNFASIATIAVILLRFVEARSKSRAFAFFTILFFLSQPSFQSMMGYSLQLISNSQPSIWLSLLAFYLHFFPPKRTLLWNERFPQPLQVGADLL